MQRLIRQRITTALFAIVAVMAQLHEAWAGQPAGSVYVQVWGGAPLSKEYDTNITGLGSGTYEPDSGYYIAGSVGTYLRPNIRAELQAFRAHGEDGEVVFPGGTPIPHAGSVTASGILANVFYEFDLNHRVTPYVGAGLGFVNFDFDDLGAIGGTFTVDDSKTVFAAAFHAGVDIPLSSRWTITTRYSLGYSDGATFSTSTAGTTITKDDEINHLFGAGLRLKLQ